ncbi:MAG: ribosome silencing factor [Planctomycetes bacterium]|nr:ribosome silencing factor [Planctomycetota bacterium]
MRPRGLSPESPGRIEIVATRRSTLDPLQLAQRCAAIAREKLGEDIEILDVSNLLKITDYFVIVTGRNRRHVQTIAAEIDQRMKAAGVSKAKIEGTEEGLWILLDFDSVVVHLQQQAAREHYALEHLWADAPRIDLEEPGDQEMAG